MKPKCLIVYASMSGNTEMMSEAIAQGASEAGCELETKPIHRATAEDLVGYDGILLGSYTWGDGELPDEALDFYDELKEISLTGTKAAVFGSCDSNYLLYGGAVDLIEERLREKGAILVSPGLKVDRMPKSVDLANCRHFGKLFAESLIKYA